MAGKVTKKQDVLSTHPALGVETLGNEPPSHRDGCTTGQWWFLRPPSVILQHQPLYFDDVITKQHSGDGFGFLDLLVSTLQGVQALAGTSHSHFSQTLRMNSCIVWFVDQSLVQLDLVRLS